MTIEQAVGELKRAGSLAVVAGAIRYEIRNRGVKTAEAVATLKARKSEALAMLSNSAAPKVDARPLEAVLQGRAIELWSTAEGRLFLVADEGDARLACERLGARRGEIYTAAEVRRIVAVDNPSAVAEIHDWKRRFDAVISNEK
jgi:hypothetical protein